MQTIWREENRVCVRTRKQRGPLWQLYLWFFILLVQSMGIHQHQFHPWIYRVIPLCIILVLCILQATPCQSFCNITNLTYINKKIKRKKDLGTINCLIKEIQNQVIFTISTLPSLEQKLGIVSNSLHMSCVASLSACKNARFSTSKPYYTSFLSIDQTLLCKFHMIVLLVFTFKLGLFLEVSSVAYDTVCGPSHQTDICCIKTTRSQNSSLVLGIFHFRIFLVFCNDEVDKQFHMLDLSSCI